jgi:hypothetical protein
MILILVVLLFIIIILLNTKYINSVSGLKVRFTSLADGTSSLEINYVNPQNFGNGANWKNTFLYVTECKSSSDCGTTVTHPSIEQLTTLNLFRPFLITDPSWFSKSDTPSVPSGNVSINIPIKNTIPTMVPGKTYNIGVGIYSDKKSIYGTQNIPNIYGDFSYTTISYGDPPGPGQVSKLTTVFN